MLPWRCKHTKSMFDIGGKVMKPHKSYWYLAHPGYDNDIEGMISKEKVINYHMDNPPSRKDIMEYWCTHNIFEAKKFGSSMELFSFLEKNPGLMTLPFIVLNYTDEYLESIKDKPALEYIRKLRNL